MLVIYVPPSELSRFGADLSVSGDILVPQVIPPDEKKYGELAIAAQKLISTLRRNGRSSHHQEKYSPESWWKRL